MDIFFLAFIPLFVAIDPFGTIPLFLGLTHGFNKQQKHKLALQAVLTAFAMGLLFCGAGHLVFSFIGITPSDFKIAGGILLLVFSIREIFGKSIKLTIADPGDAFLGVVPLGIPLIAGPAMITTILILHDLHGFSVTLSALILNLVVTWGLFVSADWIIHKTGEAFWRAMTKVVAIFLAAIGIMMIRRGIETLLSK